MGTTNLTSAPVTLESGNYSAIDLRRMVTSTMFEGALALGDFAVTQRVAGANMSIDVAQGRAYVQGDHASNQSLYFLFEPAAKNVLVTASDASNPRIDIAVLEVKDDAHDLSGMNLGRIRTIEGTPTPGATLDNRSGAPVLPPSCMLLADLRVPAGSTSLVNANIRDRRPRVSKSARVANTTTQTIANMAETLLTFDTDLHDYDDIHSTISQTGRMNISTYGTYDVAAAISWAANTTGDRIMRILVNGVVIVSDCRRALGTAGVDMGHTITAPAMPLNPGDYVECRVWQNSGAPLAAGTLSLSIARIG